MRFKWCVSFFWYHLMVVFSDNWQFCYFFLFLPTYFFDDSCVRKYHESTLILFFHSDVLTKSSALTAFANPEPNYRPVYWWSPLWFPLGSAHKSLWLAYTKQLFKHWEESSVPFVYLVRSEVFFLTPHTLLSESGFYTD